MAITSPELCGTAFYAPARNRADFSKKGLTNLQMCGRLNTVGRGAPRNSSHEGAYFIGAYPYGKGAGNVLGYHNHIEPLQKVVASLKMAPRCQHQVRRRDPLGVEAGYAPFDITHRDPKVGIILPDWGNKYRNRSKI